MQRRDNKTQREIPNVEEKWVYVNYFGGGPLTC